MSSSTEAQRLIALSLGKIAISRQQKGGINLHKNLLVASVLHKARTTYMMDNFQTLLANRRAQAEKEAASKMIVEKPVVNTVPDSTTSMEVTVVQREVTDSCNTPNNVEAPHGKISEQKSTAQVDKENVLPVKENESNCDIVSSTCDMDKNDLDKQNPPSKDLSAPTQGTPIVSGKVPLKEHTNLANYVNQSTTCRCMGNKRRRSFVSDYDSISEPKKPRFEDDCENYISDSESDCESDSSDVEQMQTEPSQVTNLVDIFNSGFNGLCKDTDKTTSSSQINVYVSTDRSVSGHQYVLADLTCGTQMMDNTVAIPTAIALAV